MKHVCLSLVSLVCLLIHQLVLACFRLYRPSHGRLLFPAEIIDLLKGFIIGVCVYVMSHIDTSMMYHLIKSQSVIKLYLFYNMLEVTHSHYLIPPNYQLPNIPKSLNLEQNQPNFKPIRTLRTFQISNCRIEPELFRVLSTTKCNSKGAKLRAD